jgi:hypothetical protein
MKNIGFFRPPLDSLKRTAGQARANMVAYRILASLAQRAPHAAHCFGRLPFAPAWRVSVNGSPKRGARRVDDEEGERGEAVSRRTRAPARAEDGLDRLPECSVPEPEQTRAVLSEHANRWQDHLDYFGCAVYIRTEQVRAAGTQQPVEDSALWESVLRIGLPRLADGTPEALAYEQIAHGTRPGIGKYAALLGRQVPIGKDMVKTYATREEAMSGHARLVIYLEQFMCVRRLFHPVVEEMQARRSAFLLGPPQEKQDAPLPGAIRIISRQSSLRNKRKRSLLDNARHLLQRLQRGRARPNQAGRRHLPSPGR